MTHKKQRFGYALFLASVLILCVGIWKIPLHQSKQMYKVGIAVYDLDDIRFGRLLYE